MIESTTSSQHHSPSDITTNTSAWVSFSQKTLALWWLWPPLKVIAEEFRISHWHISFILQRSMGKQENPTISALLGFDVPSEMTLGTKHETTIWKNLIITTGGCTSSKDSCCHSWTESGSPLKSHDSAISFGVSIFSATNYNRKRYSVFKASQQFFWPIVPGTKTASRLPGDVQIARSRPCWGDSVRSPNDPVPRGCKGRQPRGYQKYWVLQKSISKVKTILELQVATTSLNACLSRPTFIMFLLWTWILQTAQQLLYAWLPTGCT